MTDIEFPLPDPISRAEAESAIRQANRKFPGLEVAAHVREAARSLGVDVATVNKAMRANNEEPVSPAKTP